MADAPVETMKLQYPIAWGSEVVDTLSFRRPKAKDLKHVTGKGDTAEVLMILSKITNQPPSLLDELDVVDLNAAGAIIAGFLQNSQPTGDSGSAS